MVAVRPVALIGAIRLVYVMSIVAIAGVTAAIIEVRTRLTAGVAALAVIKGLFFLRWPVGET